MAYFRLLLLPFSVLYGLIIWMRNRFYDWGWIGSTSFNNPIIVVGNLAVGGTGKSPMTEYLIRLLAGKYNMATLSRGYGRKTQGFLEVSVNDSATKCGDEPLQFKHKFPHITVAVSENRVKGIVRLIQSGHEAIVLDDAFQHRALRPGFAILLFDYQSMWQPKWLLPAGNYRDCFQERRRADIMVVTKTPVEASNQEKERIRHNLSTSLDVPVLFSSIGYGPLIPILPEVRDGATLDRDISVLLITGIVNPTPLYDYLATQVKDIVQLRYPDHHQYTLADIQKMVNRFDELKNPRKLIITTEKDAQRFLTPTLSSHLTSLPMYMVPIRITFENEDEDTFRELVLNYCANTLADNNF
ncbi:tetraacyldisaccharide 4'-kinase [Parapedobacter tibetensis]|uniref:tetraacyldisaccharide 4'-kinase n=1 Tax=Parapedobacter tibetensis TaxID=2972951 RepID=UPI00214D80A4|nr:tetraacyldisaccharide 4'-kinase [Parapedobacter tibetensis]